MSENQQTYQTVIQTITLTLLAANLFLTYYLYQFDHVIETGLQQLTGH